MNSGFLDKLIERVDRVEPGEVQSYLIRLIREKGFLEQVFEALQEGVMVMDEEGEVTYMNGTVGRLFGIDPEASVGKPLRECIRGLEWSSLVQEGQGARVVSRDLEVFYPENRYLNFYLSPIDVEAAGEEEGENPGYVMIIRDITRDRQMAEEKIESERLTALTMLAAGVAHELGNPLNSLTIHLQLMERALRKGSKPDSVTDMLAVAQDEIRRLDFIIKQFLGAVRPSEAERKLSDVNEIVRESVRFLEPELTDRGIGLKMELHANLPLMRVDADQVKQAFYNLIRNASQAMGGGGALLIRTNMDDYEVRVSFRDTGTGMGPEQMSRAFQPYFTTKETGSGLGLLIVRRIVREHGGEIEIESEEGVGTTVTAHFPKTEKSVRFLEAGD